VGLQHYDEAIDHFGPAFVWPIAGRNLALLLFTWMVCAPIVRTRERTGSRQPAHSQTSDPAGATTLSNVAATHPGS
jgi:hypothetical protein